MMTSQNVNSQIIQNLNRLIQPGLLGFFTQFEVTEIFMTTNGEKDRAFNLFTILVAQEQPEQLFEKPAYLSSKPIRTKKLKNTFFGIRRYLLPISSAIESLDALAKYQKWQQSNDCLSFGMLCAVPPIFVPPDSMELVPLNKVLKNNFWNGSHVFEWVDPTKPSLQHLYNEPSLLQELSPLFQKYVPINLASLSDRLGNLIIQLPATIFMYSMRRTDDRGTVQIDLAWHPKAEPRTLRANFDLGFDKCFSGYKSSIIKAPQTLLPVQCYKGEFRHVIWDEENQVVLAATAPSSFCNSISFGAHISNPEPRVFKVTQQDGTLRDFRIPLIEHTKESAVGKNYYDVFYESTQKRMYNDEIKHLEKQKQFIQYLPKAGQQQSEHERALDDLRSLINQYGMNGAWLWDPYLSANDVLKTLFHCKYIGADLRALTSGKSQSSDSSYYKESQRRIFQESESNWQGLNFEFRVRTGNSGWEFHDRFIIFPNTREGTLAWSLGTSVNSLGKSHHILQRVDNGQIVMDAFLELWNQLNKSDNIIWKKTI